MMQAAQLPESEQDAVAELLLREVASQNASGPSHGVLDIAPISLGNVLSLPDSNDDLLGEMLEGDR